MGKDVERLGGLFLRKFLILFACCAALLPAQDTSSEQQPSSDQAPPPDRNNALTSLAGDFFQGDFFNIYAFGNGVFDSTSQTLSATRSQQVSSVGIDVGGGVTLSHEFSRSLISLNYRGDYRDYQGSYLGSGTNQYLSVLYATRFGRRWTLSLAESGAILLYGQGFYTTENPNGTVVNNPFSPETRFSSSSVYLSYQQTRRLTYTLGSSLFLNRYNSPGAIGATGAIVSASVAYQTSSRTSIGGTYSHDDFYFQHSFGDSHLNGVFANLNHRFGRTWNTNVSGGFTNVNTSGEIRVPVTFIFNGQQVTGYEVGHYNSKSNVPTISAGLNHTYRRYTMSVSGGRGVNPGNGTILTSTRTSFGAVLSRSLAHSSLSAAGYYNHLTSIANKVSSNYTQTNLTIAYSRILIPHVSANLNYSFLRYGNFLSYGGSNDNRLFFGFTFSSKNIPLTIF